MSETKHAKVLIIGAGPAGYTAAIYAARANLRPVLIQGPQPGGQLTITTEVENYPGFGDVVQGPRLMEEMERQARKCRRRDRLDTVNGVDFGTRLFYRQIGFRRRLSRRLRDHMHRRASPLAGTGRRTDLQRARRFRLRHLRRVFHREKEVCVVGGGNTAVEEALYLAGVCSKVTLIHRRDSLRAEKILQDRLRRNEKIEMVWDSVVEDILGDDMGVTAVRVRNVGTGDVSHIPAHGLFVAIGHDPATAIFKGEVDMDDDGYIITAPDSTATNVPASMPRATSRTRCIGKRLPPPAWVWPPWRRKNLSPQWKTRSGNPPDFPWVLLPNAKKSVFFRGVAGRRRTNRKPPAVAGRLNDVGIGWMAMDWDKLRVFHVVAEASSFTHAGEKLNLSQSAVSRQISALEDSIRVPLFHRHARGLIPTEQGEILYKTVHDVFGKLAMTEAKLSETRGSPQGRLAVNATVAFDPFGSRPNSRVFDARYPDIEVS